MTKRLWDKGEELNNQVQAFTVGNDPLLDKELVYFDAIGSGAQARMLEKIGVLTNKECSALLDGLKQIVELSKKGDFEIPIELEDCHTAIENYLSSQAEEAGGKIHTGRSRNDQVILAVRLYLRHHTVAKLSELGQLCRIIQKRIEEFGNVPMPGYTHFQPAMPSSIGMWLHAYLEAFLEQIHDGLRLLEQLDRNPLGAASGFGSSLTLDRKFVSSLLGFGKTQRSPIDIQNSRGRIELKYIRWGVDIAGIIEKLSWDIVLYSTREYGFLSLPSELTTGSSIMPQKRNPDVVELLRARASKLRAAEDELRWVASKLPSNYHRDLQYTKEPILRCTENLEQIVPIVGLVLNALVINEDKLEEAMSADLYATYDAYRRVGQGTPFRVAYRETAEQVHRGMIDKEELRKDFAQISSDLKKEIAEALKELSSAEKKIQAWKERLAAVDSAIFKN